MPKVLNLIGKKFGKLTVIERDGSQCGHSKWKCQCDCGNIISVIGSNLKSGSVFSCGCYKKERQAKICAEGLIDLTGQRFENLIVLERAYDKEKEKSLTYRKVHPIWKCKCDCGNICYYFGRQLKQGLAKSCGCINSFGNQKIMRILQENNFHFKKEYNIKYKDKNYRYDFAIFDKNNKLVCLIEYDGIQHFSYTNRGWNTEENYKKVIKSDFQKNRWAKEYNIPLIRIPYWDYDKINIEYLKQKFIENNYIFS